MWVCWERAGSVGGGSELCGRVEKAQDVSVEVRNYVGVVGGSRSCR